MSRKTIHHVEATPCVAGSQTSILRAHPPVPPVLRTWHCGPPDRTGRPTCALNHCTWPRSQDTCVAAAAGVTRQAGLNSRLATWLPSAAGQWSRLIGPTTLQSHKLTLHHNSTHPSRYTDIWETGIHSGFRKKSERQSS